MTNTTNNIVFIDVETTGIDVEHDRVISIGMYNVDTECKFYTLIKPSIPMSLPQEIIAITGIKDEDLQNAPTFANVAQKILDFIGNADIAGHNIMNFDLPILAAEFARVGILWPAENSTMRVHDTLIAERTLNRRDLNSLHVKYCKTPVEHLHTAVNDAYAAYEIYYEQLKLANIALSKHVPVDPFDHVRMVGENLVFSKGRLAGKRIIDYREEAIFCIHGNYPPHTKNAIKHELSKHGLL